MKEKITTLKNLNHSLFAYDKKFYLWYGLDIVLTIILPLIQLYVTSYVISLLINQVDLTYYIRELSFRMLLLILVQGLSALMQSKLEKHGEVFRASQLLDVYMARLTQDYPLLLGSQASELFKASIRALDNRWEALNMTINSSKVLFTSLVSTLIYINILGQLDWIFIILICILLGLLIYIKIKQERIIKAIQPIKVENNSKYYYINSTMGEQRIAKDVRLYSMKDWFNNIQKKLWTEYVEIIKPESRIARIEGLVMIFFLTMMSALAYRHSIQGVMNGEIEVASFVVYVSLVMMVTNTLTTLVSSLAEFSQNTTKLTNLYCYLNQNQIFNHYPGAALPQKNFTIEFKNVSYCYPNSDMPVFKNLNLIIHPQEKLAIVGENGAGKSTLIKLLMGLIKADEGEILLNGVSIEDYNISEYYDFFAPVFQDDALFTMTIKDTIIQGISYDEEKYQRVLVESGMDEIIKSLPKGEETHLIKQIDPDAVQLSGGQMQKLKLAKALYKDSPVMVLDEPTAALDPIAESEVYQNYLNFSQGKVALFISHRLASTQFCDRIIYLKQGEIREDGTHQELMALKGDYYQLFETQAYYYRENVVDQEEDVEVGGVI